MSLLHEFDTIIDMFRVMAFSKGEKTAFTFLSDGESEDSHLTYQELDRRARAIAALLLSQLGQPGERVLLLYPPGLEYISAFMGCLYAGMVAVPSYPPRLNRPDPRLQIIAQDAQASVALTTPQILASIRQRLENSPDLASIRWLVTQDLGSEQAQEWKAPQVTGDSLAFLQYTSGSTAQPKGVMVSHGNLLHNLKQIHQFFEMNSQSRGVIWLPPYHDMGLIGGILETLYTGISTVLMPPTAFLQKPARWLRAISCYGGTISGAPNFAYEFCVQKITEEQKKDLDLSSWKVAFTGAEPIHKETLERFASTFEPYGLRRETLYACYGLAEATLIVSGGKQGRWPTIQAFARQALAQNRAVIAGEEHKDTWELVSCGKCAGGQRLLIVDPQSLKRCPEDQVGEIWLSGASVALGYWNKRLETAETFQAHLADAGEGPFMRTGDLGFVHGGELYVTGRSKDLIIIRGRNHYPQDIELTVETSHPALQPASGAAFSVDVQGEERLVIVQEVERHTRTEEVPGIVASIRQAVLEAHELQVHAVVLVRVGSVPKTSSGKIQRRACRNQFLEGNLVIVGSDTLELPAAQSAPAEPSNPQTNFIRKALTALDEPAARRVLLTIYLQEQVARVLHLSSSSIEAGRPLAALGLDSLSAVELSHEIETSLGVALSMAEWLQGPSIAQLADSILAQFGRQQVTGSTADGAQLQFEAPLSHGQQAIWFLNQLAPESAAYNVPSAVRARSELDVPALQRAFEQLVSRHAALRTTFEISPLSAGPVQRVHLEMPLDFESIDASAWDEITFKERLDKEAQRPFDLARGPLLRVRVFERARDDYAILVVMHHIITDFWSLALMVDELSRLYPAHVAGQPIKEPAARNQYLEYVDQQEKMLAGPRGEQLWAYWQEKLHGDLPVLNMPTDHPRPPVQTYNGNIHTLRLNARLTEQLKSLSQAHEATLNMTLAAAFNVLLHRYTGQQDFLTGTLATGRDHASQAGTMGYFVNPIVLRAKPAPHQTFTEFLTQTRQTTLGAFEHQDYPFDVLVNRLQPVRDTSRSPLFQVMFVFQRAYKFNDRGLTSFALDIAGRPMELAGLQLESMVLEHRVAQFDLTLTMGEADHELVASFEYNTDLYDAGSIARMAVHLETLLAGIVDHPEARLADLPLFPEMELRQLLATCQGERVEQATPATIRVLFEAQVARTPDLPAVLFGDRHLSYRELNDNADRLSAYLHDLGVGPEVIVSICMERSLEMVVGILAVLKAEGAYVPLDPTYPHERLAFILAETNSPVLLTQSYLREGLPVSPARTICLDTDWELLPAASPQRLADTRDGDPRQAACVIYTSGSTGKPKGVLLENRGLVNLVESFTRSYTPTTADRILPLTSVGSASFVGEIFPLLCVGGALVLARVEEFLDPDRLFELIAVHHISIISAVPTVIAGLNQKKGNLSSLRWLLSGGEALDMEDVDELLKSVSIVNSYGLTETSVCSMFYQVGGEPSGARGGVPIGLPIINTGAYVLDRQLNCLPVGCPGELYISGLGIARGYQGNPGLTAQLFIPNPYEPGERMYRTGDLARWLPGGVLEYLQRADNQVKIRGFRIELGEIETVLKLLPGVRDARVVVREAAPGDKRLVAYLLAGEAPLASDRIHQALAGQLPDYMVPTIFEMLDAWPLTPNGKIDVSALPVPAGLRPSLAMEYVAPQSDMERKLALIWQSVLKVDKVGTQDNFFDLGGNSLLIAQVHQRMQSELGIQISLVDLFKYSSIGLLAQKLSRPEDTGREIREQFEDEAQKRLVALNRRKQLAQQRGPLQTDLRIVPDEKAIEDKTTYG